MARIKRTYKPHWVAPIERKSYTDNPEFYNSEIWRNASKYYRSKFITCQLSDRVVKSEHTDHIIPVRFGGAKFDERNLLALSRSMHNKKSARERHDGILVKWVESDTGKVPENKQEAIKYLKELLK